MNGTDLGASTRIALTPSQLFAVIALVVGVAAWCWKTDAQITSVRLEVASLTTTVNEMADRFDTDRPARTPRTRTR